MNENKTKINETKLLIFEKYPLKIGNKTEHMVFSIPSEFLRYNVLNGRIASNVDSSEAVKNHIDMNNNKKILEDFLWHSDIKANKKTKNSIFEDGQQKPGIITADGIVLDGNRRLMLLNKIYEETGDIRYSRFNAVILDENLTKKEIYNLEAYLQFGIDPQLEYGSIEKYLMINRRIDAGLSVKEISKSFNGKFSENEIKELIYRFELMEEYLEYIGHKGNYELLSFRKVEDSIKTLTDQIKKLKKNTHSAQKRWSISDDEISDIKYIYFDLIRLAVSSDPKDYRSLILNKNNLLENKEEWKKFSDNHFEFTKEIDRLTEDYYVDLDNSPQSKNLSSLEKIKITETKLEEHFKNELYSNLQNSLRTVEFINSNNSTLNELKVIYSKLQKVVDEYDESKVNKEGIHKYVKLIFDLLEEF
jgi:hypothetical protein